MDLNISMQTLKNVFRFPFHDPRWKTKFLIAAGLALAGAFIPLLPALPLLGYFARMMRAGARNEDPALLPEWDNWSELFLDGLRQFVVLLIAALPASVILIVGWMAYMGTFMTMPFMEDSNMSGPAMMAMFAAMGILFLSLSISIVLSLLAAVLFPPALAHVAVTRSLAGFFKFGEWGQLLRKNFLGFQVALGIFGALYAFLTVITQVLYYTLVLCILVPIITVPIGFYAGLVYFRLVGQAYGEIQPPAEEAPPVLSELEPSPAL